MPEQAIRIAAHLSGPLALVCYGLALLFGLYRLLITSKIIPELPPDTAPKIVLTLLRNSFIVLVLLIVLGSVLGAIDMLLPRGLS